MKKTREIKLALDTINGVEANLAQRVKAMREIQAHHMEWLEHLVEQLEKSQQALELEKEKSRKWEKAFDNADKQYLKKEREAAELRRKLEQAQADNQKLVECLEWYGNKENHILTCVKYPDDSLKLAHNDAGSYARNILKEVKGNA